MWGTHIRELIEHQGALMAEIEAKQQTSNERDFRGLLVKKFAPELVAFAKAAAQVGEQEREQMGQAAALALAILVVDWCKHTEQQGMNHIIGKVNQHNAAIEAEVLRDAGVKPN